MSRNWKTTAAGIVTGVASFVNFSPSLFSKWPWLVSMSAWLAAGGAVMLGITSKDYNTHSTEQEVIQAQDKKDAKDIDNATKG